MKGVAHDLAYKRNAINKLSKSVATINSHNLAYKLSPFIDLSNLEDMKEMFRSMKDVRLNNPNNSEVGLKATQQTTRTSRLD